MSSNKVYSRGDFSFILDCPAEHYQGTGYGQQNDYEMLRDAFSAVEKVPGGWEFLANPKAVGEGGFMFSKDISHPDIRAQIDSELFKTPSGSGHSGASYAGTMRVMEYIAKNGWNMFIRYWCPYFKSCCHCDGDHWSLTCPIKQMMDYVRLNPNSPIVKELSDNFQQKINAVQ